MKKLLLLVLVLFPVLCAGAEKRDLLTGTYNREAVSRFCAYQFDWVPFPAYADRAAWESLPAEKRAATIAAGEQYLGFGWPSVLPTMYLEFTRTGNRAVVDRVIAQRLTALRSLLFAELVEGKGRFLDDIINGVYAYCEQTFWGSSAHFYLYDYGCAIEDPPTKLPDDTDPVIDLTTGDAAATLAWTWYFLHDAFDAVSPLIGDRLVREMHRKVLDPYYEKNDMWWMTGWNRGNVNNWTPWCSYNLLTSILLIETDPARRLDGVYKSMGSVDLYINSYPADGGCNEGPSYWGAAVGHLHNYLTLLKTFTHGQIDLFGQDIIQEMGRYIYKLYIGGGDRYVNFADAPARLQQGGVKIARYGRQIGDAKMEGFGAFLADKYNAETQPLGGDVAAALFDAFWEKPGTASAEVLVADAYLPDLQVAAGRDRENSTEGFFFAAKGGNNAEQHNHNDVGSFVLYYDGKPAFVDPGVGTYTRETFSGKRYEIWTMQSGYHNLPVIRGVMQSPGGAFAAAGSAFKADARQVRFSTDIAGAYPEAAGAAHWVREYTLQRGRKFTVSDSYELEGAADGTTVVFMTPLPCTEQDGALVLSGDGFALRMTWPAAKLAFRVEEVPMDDPRLRGVWGERLYRLCFDVKGGRAKDRFTFEVTALPDRNNP